MNRIQKSLLAVWMAAMLCPPWVYGGSNKQAGALGGAVPPVSVRQGFDHTVINQEAAEMAALDAATRIPWVGDNRQRAQSLFARLKERRIAIQPTFYKMLGKVNPVYRGRLVSHCRQFFDSVDAQEARNTSCLTSMLCQERHIYLFLSRSDDSVRRVARTPALKSLASLFNGRGFPKATEDTQAFMAWEVWWRGDGKERTFDRELLRTFSSLCGSKGLPGKKAVEDYLQWDIWWHGEGEARTLDRELLRIFSSMLRGRGLPDKKVIDDYLRLDIWWQGEGEARTLDRELLRTFSSMFSGRGLPEKRAVDDYLQRESWWLGSGKARTLDRELLRIFSSMFCGKGLPDKKAMDDYLQLDIWWQGEGKARTLDRELLRVFSSMFNCRGLPDQKTVEDYLQLDVWWQGEGEARTLDRELLRTFSSMFCGRKVPDQKAVEEYLQWEVWWLGVGKARTLDRELLRSFSSMFSCRGLPDKQAVDGYLQLDVWWQGEGEARTLDRELLRTFSSMFKGKGIPDKKAVGDYLKWDIWWRGEGKVRTLDRELLRSVSSMFSGRGLPEKKRVEDYLQWELWWQGEGKARTLDRNLLRIFSSMFCKKGLPAKEALDNYLSWDIWWQGEGEARTLDRDLLHVFSSMLSRRGLPDKKTVDNYLSWDVWWQGEGEARTLDRQLLHVFSSMFSGKGLPNRRCTDEVLQWLAWDKQAIRVMARLYSGVYAGHKSLGLPDINTLRKAEQRLMVLIPPEQRGQDEDNDILPLIKMVALYLANDGGTRQLCWNDCEAWLREYPSFLSKKSLLRQLLVILHHHGGQGLKEAVALISGKPAATQLLVLEVLGSGQPLAGVQYAVQAIEPTEWQEYLFFTRGLHPMPSSQTWETIKGYLETLAPVLPRKEYRHQFLTLIWLFAPADRKQFIQPEVVYKLTTLLPSVQVMRNLMASLTTDELRTLFDIFLIYWATQCPKGLCWESADSYDHGPGAPKARQQTKPYLTVAMLSGLLKCRVPMHSMVWASADYHKEKLSPSLLVLLKERADGDSDALIPESLKAFLSECDQRSLGSAAHGHQAPLLSSVTPSMWLETMLRQSVLNEADLNQLYAYRDQLTLDHVIDILLRMDQSVSQDVVQGWSLLLTEGKHQALTTNSFWQNNHDGVMGALPD